MKSLNIIFIVGLPCSGKTFLSKKLLEKYDKSLYIDDPIDFSQVKEHLNNDDINYIIISDVNLCRKDVREKAISLIRSHSDRAIYFEWIYFENTPDKCFVNYVFRQAKGDLRKVANTIIMMSKVYDIPEFATVKEIWQPSDEQLNK